MSEVFQISQSHYQTATTIVVLESPHVAFLPDEWLLLYIMGLGGGEREAPRA